VVGAILGKQAPVQNPDKDEAPDSSTRVEQMGLYATKRGERPRSLAVR